MSANELKMRIEDEDDLRAQRAILEAIEGRSIFVMGREHFEDENLPFYELRFGGVFDGRVLLIKKDTGYFKDKKKSDE